MSVWKHSLRNKLFFSLLFIGFFPFLVLLIYSMYLTESKLMKQTIDEEFSQMQITNKLLQNYLTTLQKDVTFLSSLDVMDNLFAEDIDKKIARLLEQKAKDLGDGTKIVLIDNNSTIIASSNAADISHKYSLQQIAPNKPFIITKKCIYFIAKVHASFDTSRQIGFLILKYRLDNLRIFLSHQKGIHSYILNAADNTTIGDRLNFTLNLTNTSNHIITDKYVVVYKKLDFFQNNWYLIYAVNKSIALASLYDFIKFMIYISIIILALLLFFSLKYAKSILQPIEKLTLLSKEITQTQDYSKQLQCTTDDEIKVLTQAFNTMLFTTSKALKKLEDESKQRLAQYTQLIKIFNTIIQTQKEQECITISLQEIKILTNHQKISFAKHPPTDTQQYIDLYVIDSQNSQTNYYGSIHLGFSHFKDTNEQKLYHAIAEMITFQLDRIRLIQNTLSVSKAKSAFISNMSHELRTPLNAIISATQFMLTYENLSDDQQDSIANIESSAHYLLEMINGILDIAKIEAGKMPIHYTTINIVKLVQESISIILPLIDDKHLSYHFTTAQLKKEEIYTDAKILQQILLNLLSNAIKFTQEGSITIHISQHNDTFSIEITDTGIGIAPENIQLLFNDFTQVENIMQKKHKGTGLGLSLSQKMAHLINADLELRSEGINKGTTVMLTIAMQ